MPAAAVIPAPIAYIKVVAVKKLVVGFRGPRRLLRSCWTCPVGRGGRRSLSRIGPPRGVY